MPKRSQEEIDYLSEEIFLRILAKAHIDADGNDFVGSFTAAAQYIDLPAHVRLQQLTRSFSFWLQHPILAYKLSVTRRALERSAPSRTSTGDISLERQCIRTLSSIEFSQTLKATAARQARAIATHCNWGPSQLRDSIRMGILKPNKGGAYLLLIRPNHSVDITQAVLGTIFGMISFVLFGYCALSVITCGFPDCAAMGNFILGWIFFSFSWLLLYSFLYRTFLFGRAKQFFAT